MLSLNQTIVLPKQLSKLPHHKRIVSLCGRIEKNYFVPDY